MSVTTFASTFTARRRTELLRAVRDVVPPLLPVGIALPALHV